jgi:lysophospholipase L1-like esterase
MRRYLVVGALSIMFVTATSVTSATSGAATATSTPPLPSSMAAIGDSMTQAANVCCWYGDHPANSWSTGNAWWDGVSSHYERIRAAKPDIAGQQHNNAVSGARMSDAPAQAQRAVKQQAKYVTILMGANDLCTSSTASMTPADTFRAQFRQSLAILNSGLPPRARIFVSSIPNVYQLWSLYHGDLIAELIWATARICQSLLSPSNTDADRRAVQDREVEFNAILAQECGQYANCRFDDNAVFNYTFTRNHVSRLDYFHPSLAGQTTLAEVTWRASWWG